MDPVLFENFLTEDGDLLRAKFQAFKFPETNFVLFKGIVNVCLDKCRGVRKPFLLLFLSICVGGLDMVNVTLIFMAQEKISFCLTFLSEV